MLFVLHIRQIPMKNIFLLVSLLFLTACGLHNIQPYYGNDYDFYDAEGAYSPSVKSTQPTPLNNNLNTANTSYSGSSVTSLKHRRNQSYYTPSYNKPVKVRGYYRKNGTYVKPHTRSRPRSR